MDNEVPRRQIILTSAAVTADASAIATSIRDGLSALTSTAAVIAVVMGAFMYFSRWGRPVDKWTTMAVAATLTGVVVFILTLPGGSTPVPANAATSHERTTAPSITDSAPTTTTDPAPPVTSTSVQPPGGAYTEVIADKEISVPVPEACDPEYQIDLDEPAVGQDVLGDAQVEYCDLSAGVNEPVFQNVYEGKATVGEGPPTRPQPEACHDSAQQRPAGNYLIADFERGKTAFCVITDGGAVAWLHFTGTPSDRTLIFHLTLWRQEL